MERANSSIGRGRYMGDGAWPSLFRNGRVLTRRDRDGNDANSEGVDTTEYTIAINDGRALDDDRRRTVESHEFELLSRPLERSNGENYFAKHAPRHAWWWFPAMTRNEPLLIKQWDSAGELARSGGVRADSSAGNGGAPCTFSFHTAFKDSATPPDARDRQSIEVRCIVLYD